jgi:transmembrane sensor
MRFDPQTQRRVQDEAIGWVIRLRDAGEQDWEAFTAWLEADPAHAVAYDEAALTDVEAEHLPPSPEAKPLRPTSRNEFEAQPSRRGLRRGFVGWAAAASIVLSAGYLALGTGDSAYLIETAAGERRIVALEDGSRIELNGNSRVELDSERPRYAKLEQGEALFEVVHDAARPFEVEAGGTLLRDMGTVFNVVAEKQRLEVAVSEGAVLYDPAGEAEKLTPGMVLRKEGAAPVSVGPVSTDAVGGWREGRLIYSAAPVSAVAADLSRNLGLRVAAEEAVASRPFSGVILLAGQPREVLERSAALLGLELQRSGETWLLTRTGAPR